MKAKCLKKGDTIGVVATSEPITDECMEDFEKAVSIMQKLDVNVKFAKHVKGNPTGYGETAKNKAKDINCMFADKEVNAIFCAMRWF